MSEQSRNWSSRIVFTLGGLLWFVSGSIALLFTLSLFTPSARLFIIAAWAISAALIHWMTP